MIWELTYRVSEIFNLILKMKDNILFFLIVVINGLTCIKIDIKDP